MVITTAVERSHTYETLFLAWLWSKRSTKSRHDDKTVTVLTLDTIVPGKRKEDTTITISDALERTLYGKFNYFVIAISGLMLSNVMMETAGAAFYMPVSQCELGLTNTRKGLLSAIGYSGMIISSHIWGFLADSKGRKRIMQPTMLAAFAVTFLSSFSSNFWVILFLRFINGICISGASSTVYAYLGELHSDRSRSRAMMVSSFIYALGITAMPFIAYSVINREWRLAISFMGFTYKPWRLFIIVCGLPGLLCGIAMCYLPESPKYLLTADREDEAKEVLQQIYRSNGGQGKLELPHIVCSEDSAEAADDQNQKSHTLGGFFKGMWNQTVMLFGRKYIRSTAIACTAQFWFYVISNGLYMWFPYIVNSVAEFVKTNPGEQKLLCQIVYDKHDKIDTLTTQNSTFFDCPDKLEDTTYLYSFILEFSYVVAFAIISLIVNHVGQITIMFVLTMFSCACGFVAVLLPDISIASIFYILFFIVGVCINLMSAATVDLYPTQLRAIALSVSLMMGRIGSVVGTNFVGGLLAKNCELTFYITCCALVSCALMLLFLPRNKNAKKSLDDAES